MKGDTILQLASMMGLAMTEMDKYYHTKKGDNRQTKSTKELAKSKAQQKGKLFKFDDGFECYALNQNNADRKHDKWKSKRVRKGG